MVRRLFIKRVGTGILGMGMLSSLSFFKKKKIKPQKPIYNLDRGLYTFVYDSRFRKARALSSQAIKTGITTCEINGDITDVWYNKLRPYWGKGNNPVSGVTTTSSLFLLSQMAKDQGKKVIKQETLDIQLIHWTIA